MEDLLVIASGEAMGLIRLSENSYWRPL